MPKSNKTPPKDFRQHALDFHKFPTPGKISIAPTKPLSTSEDLSLAYSPGVAFPCEEIHRDKDLSYEYTSRGNMVAVISNGTAVLGLGNLGAAASKPVMEGKSVLFKKFGAIDSIDVEINSENIDEIVRCISLIGESWGGINLEDFKSPECFEIEKRLKQELNVPVFHDDQHGTAIITLAGLLNAAEIARKKFKNLKIVVNGSGAAGIACLELICNAGVKRENVILCDSSGPIYRGRTSGGITDLKAKYAVETSARTLDEALQGADVFLGLSVKDVLTPEMLKGMSSSPIIFAMANPDPEIKPELAREVRPDAIIATGRSDYPNQVNNVMGFPYIFRGALDVRASAINEEMKIAAAHAISKLAREPIPYEVLKAYPHRNLEYGPNYIIPTPFDPRLISVVSSAVAQAAMDTNVARHQIKNMSEYRRSLNSKTQPALNSIDLIFSRLKDLKTPKRIIFAEGEEASIIRVATIMASNRYARPILIGRESRIKEACLEANIDLTGLDIAIENASLSSARNDEFSSLLFSKLQRSGYLERDCERLIKTDRNIFAATMLLNSDADALITGYTRSYNTTLTDIRKVIGFDKKATPFGFCVITSKQRTVMIGDTSFHERPNAETLAQIAKTLSEKAAVFGIQPRVAFTSYSNFGSRSGEEISVIKEAISILDNDRSVKFEYDGEMTVKTALSDNPKEDYPFNRLTGPATILITTNLSVSNFAVNLISKIDLDATVIGPTITGLEKPVQILKLHSDFNSILTLSTISLVVS